MEQKDSGEDEGARSAGGKIPLIKIKIPKKAAEETAAAAGEEGRSSHYCKECNRSFNSGKALGGHMSSAHVQANKDYSSKNLSSKRKSPAASYSDDTLCKHCGRVFMSKKSLFGHMRCHPERQWRGMEPPAEMHRHNDYSSLFPSDEEDDIGIDIAIDGGGGGGGGGGDQIDTSSPKLGFFNVKGWPTSKRGRGAVASNLGNSEAAAAGTEVMKEEEKDEVYLAAIEVLVSGKREKAEAMKGEIGTTSSGSPEKYKCNECSRVFSTHQALGGHRSSHNKFKLNIINTNARDQLSEINTNSSKKKGKEKKKKKKKNVVNTGGASTSGTAFAFDLNVAPEVEEEEDSSNHTSSNS